VLPLAAVLRLRPFLCASMGSLVFGLVSLSRPARADTEAIRIEYRAAAGCPRPAKFHAEVFRRTASARIAEEGELARTFIIVIERAPAGVTGSLVIRETDGATVARKVTGAACSEVATVLALATALAIDPTASLEAVEAAPDPEPEPNARSRSAQARSTTPPQASEAEDGNADEGFSAGDGALPAAFFAWKWHLALGPSLAVGFAPKPSVGAAIALERGTFAGAAPVSAFGVELSYLRGLPKEVNGATSSFDFFLARPRVCFLAFVFGHARLSPCAVFELGAVSGHGSELPLSQSHTRFWASAQIAPRLTLPIAAAWFLDADAGLVFPLTRYRFVFRKPDTLVYPVPAVAGAFSVKLGHSF
jgi:hypothetical protein